MRELDELAAEPLPQTMSRVAPDNPKLRVERNPHSHEAGKTTGTIQSSCVTCRLFIASLCALQTNQLACPQAKMLNPPQTFQRAHSNESKRQSEKLGTLHKAPPEQFRISTPGHHAARLRSRVAPKDTCHNSSLPGRLGFWPFGDVLLPPGLRSSLCFQCWWRP